MNETELIRRAMSALGSRKSDAKTAAARENGKKGGPAKWKKKKRKRTTKTAPD